MLEHIDLLLVIGSRNSSNSNRLVEVARVGGVPAYLIDDETEIDEAWITPSMSVVGVTSGASAPEKLVTRVCDWFRARGAEVEPYAMVDEDVTFKLPIELRRELALAESQT
jgi:4-hydroxy-3-methylbut-2-enyl diphosphate reductase